MGQGVLIDRLVPADASALSVSHSDPDNARYQGWRSPLSEPDAKHFIDAQADAGPLAPGSETQLAIREGPEGPLAGDLYLARTPSAPWSAEIGVTLTPGCQGQGLAMAAIAAVVDAVFAAEPPGGPVHRIVALLDVDNLRSRGLFERLGFRLGQPLISQGAARTVTPDAVTR